MFLLRILFNVALLTIELGLVAGLAWLAAFQPLIFAGMTAVATLAMGVMLERARIAYELGFYVAGGAKTGSTLGALVGIGTGFTKSLVTGFVALLTFSGTNADRRFWIACAFAVTLFFGISALRRLWLSFSVRAARVGYFRLALPLGIVFTLAIALLQSLNLIKVPTFASLMRQMVLDFPAKPSLEQASELLFQLKQYIDSVLVALLQVALSAETSNLIGLFISVNVLTGLVVAVWAVVIAELSLWLERRGKSEPD